MGINGGTHCVRQAARLEIWVQERGSSMDLKFVLMVNSLGVIVATLLMVIFSDLIANARFKRSNPDADMDTLWKTPAFIVRRTGLYVGTLLGTLAVFENNAAVKLSVATGEAVVSYPAILAESAMGLISVLMFMFIALRSADWLILANLKNDDAVKENNAAVAITEACILVGTGFVAYGALLGEGHIASSWVFFLIGQSAFVLVSYALEYIIHPSHAAKTDIQKGCIPSALIVGSMIISSALFVKNGIAGDFYGLAVDAWYFLRLMSMQMALFFIYLFCVEPYMLKVMKLTRVSLGGAAVSASAQIFIAEIGRAHV